MDPLPLFETFPGAAMDPFPAPGGSSGAAAAATTALMEPLGDLPRARANGGGLGAVAASARPAPVPPLPPPPQQRPQQQQPQQQQLRPPSTSPTPLFLLPSPAAPLAQRQSPSYVRVPVKFHTDSADLACELSSRSRQEGGGAPAHATLMGDAKTYHALKLGLGSGRPQRRHRRWVRVKVGSRKIDHC